MSTATFEVEKIPDSDIEEGARALYTGTVSFPDQENHDPEGEEIEDLLVFPVDVYMSNDEETRNTNMQAYADDYQVGYWIAIADGHRA